MEGWLLGLIVLACPVGLGLVTWLIFKMMGTRATGMSGIEGTGGSVGERLAVLEAEKQVLELKLAAAKLEGVSQGDVTVR